MASATIAPAAITIAIANDCPFICDKSRTSFRSSALIIDESRSFDEILYIMELANVQLAELEAYDRILDDAVEIAYRDLTPRLRGLKYKRVQRELL